MKQSMFYRSLPVTVPSFANKCGDIGIRILPMLLIEMQTSPENAGWIMGLVKGMMIPAALAGGFLSDRFGHKYTIILSFVLSAFGMLTISQSGSIYVVAAAAMFATFGQGLFSAPLRLLLVQSVPQSARQEALAWLRTANNGAVLVANAVAYFAASISLPLFFVFDACTSYLGAILGYRLLPEAPKHQTGENAAFHTPNHPLTKVWWVEFAAIVAIVAFQMLQMELFFTASAAQAKISFGSRGVEVFSQVMIFNTCICMLFSVYASKLLRKARPAFILGLLLQLGGILMFLTHPDQMSFFFVGALLQTFGEVCFASNSQYVLLKLIPSSNIAGRIYSLAIVAQLTARMFGAGFSFALVHSGAPGLLLLSIATAACLGLVLLPFQTLK